MKKIALAIIAVGVATAVQAASFTWGLASSDYYDKDGTTYLDSGTAFLYLGTVTASESAFNLGSATFLASSGFDAANYIYGNIDSFALSSSDNLTSVAAGQAYSIILVNKGVSTLDGFEGNYAIVTGSSEQGAIPGATTTYFAKFENYDSITTSQTMAAVPEPTSGLLMLLGLAGLALKRKRA